MIIVAWNIRGVANKATIRTLKEIKSQHRPDITLIYEPKCSGNKATEVIKALGFNFSFLEEADGYVGGIWVLWDNPALTINILETHHQYVAMEVKDPSHSPWKLTAIYAKSLWAQVMLSKYGRGQDLRQNILSKQSDSDLWRSLAKVWGSFKDNIEFFIGNGRRIRLWIDPWLKNEGSLIQKAIIPIEEENMEITLTEATDLNGGWDFNLLRRYLPDNIIYKIQAIHPPWDNLEEDKILWSLTPIGEFSIASTYRKISQQTDTQDRIWEVLWGWKGPQKIKIFMWLTLHRKLMTGARRRKLFGTGDECHRCNSLTEDQSHVLRDCPAASSIWTQLINPCKIQSFFRAPFDAWLRWNLTTELGKNNQTPWITKFSVTWWWLWRWPITKGRRLNQHPNNLIRSINIWLKKQWSVEIRHTYREGNQAADWLAKKSVKERGTGYCFIDSPFVDLRSILDADMKGASLPRCVIDL
ncbi:hypothetical protein Ahy_A01g002859 [Arachis hypogaea]|uniref:Reverse transcriptase zinc-binding domain-containing protein n=1 Tax=Arachis hypogaea TaxID=3818 RepID=A0A445ES02_ARAHY|nr:hypothetical protein Ahy_A01g002859 [Arachis hypogaea]